MLIWADIERTETKSGTFDFKAWIVFKDTWYFFEETDNGYNITYNLVAIFEKRPSRI